MNKQASSVDVVVVGAGSAGLAAARTAHEAGLSVTLLEAAHRIGGRALTDTEAFGFPFDLGCHWMHSASLNPYVAIADAHGFDYAKDAWPWPIHLGGRWASAEEEEAHLAFVERCHGAIRAAARTGRDVAFTDVTPREDRWTPAFDLWMSMLTSVDSDQISTVDAASYNDTGENWPLRDGHGALVARHFADVPVTLNARAERIDWGGTDISVTTSKGTVAARKAIVTVSTGVLGAGDIRFDPPLPDWKRAAIEGLPLGSHNRIGLEFAPGALDAAERSNFMVYADTPESIVFRVREFDRNVIVGLVGGRFSASLEKSGPAAMVDYAVERLKGVYGADIARHVVATRCSAWDGDLFVRGAYSCALPGHARDRADLAAPIDERLFFAGEATSREFFATCHGAYITGVAAAKAVTSALGVVAKR